MRVYSRNQIGIKFTTSRGVFTIRGLNQAIILGTAEVITDVPDEAWEAIKIEYAHLHEIKSGIIYAHKQVESVKAFAREMENERLEDAGQTSNEIEAELAVPANKKKRVRK